VKNLKSVKNVTNLGEIELLVTPENIAAWERALPGMTRADREALQGLIAEMTERSHWLHGAPRPLARLARSA